MWRITNILLLVFLVFALGAGGYVFYEDYLSWMDWGQEAREERTRTLNAGETIDEQGRKLRTHAASFDNVISYEAWGAWSVVPVGQSALESPLGLSNDEVLVTASRRGGGNGALSIGPIYERFTNNLVLRNKDDGSERILFSHKVAITSVLALPHESQPGLVVAYIDEDSNGDGKINEDDRIKLRLYRFSDTTPLDLPFEGRFSSFRSYVENTGLFSFRSHLDLDGDGKINDNFEPARLYEVSIEDGAVSSALSPGAIDKLQAIIDGPAEE